MCGIMALNPLNASIAGTHCFWVSLARRFLGIVYGVSATEKSILKKANRNELVNLVNWQCYRLAVGRQSG